MRILEMLVDNDHPVARSRFLQFALDEVRIECLESDKATPFKNAIFDHITRLYTRN